MDRTGTNSLKIKHINYLYNTLGPIHHRKSIMQNICLNYSLVLERDIFHNFLTFIITYSLPTGEND